LFALETDSRRWSFPGAFLVPVARLLAIEAGPIGGALAGGVGLSSQPRVTLSPVVLLVAVALNE
jgi:hypothetical protein